jgi:hypothetical protein
MSNYRRTLPVIMIPAMIFMLNSCGSAKLEPSAAELEKLIPLGKSRTLLVMKEMKKEMMAAAKSGGPAAAIKFCSLKALSITRKLAEDKELPLEIKRTSRKTRNPANQPDLLESEALGKFEFAIQNKDELPEFLVQKYEREGEEFLRYYQPITIDARCLSCHGMDDELSADVKTILKETYPDDMATGYSPGELRGLIRLEVEASKLIEVSR